jgi:hypothetical protein
MWQGGGGRHGSGGGGGGRPSNTWQLDLLVVKAGICSWLGAHVVHCLGGAWLLWLAAWLAWCGLQAALHVRLVERWASGGAVATVSLALPVAMALLPFRAGSILAQGWALEAAPALQRVPTLGGLLAA